MNDAQIAELVSRTAEETARKVIQQTFLSLGINADSPEAILEVQKDMTHLRAWRESINTVKRQSLLTAVIILTTGILGIIWVSVTRSSP